MNEPIHKNCIAERDWLRREVERLNDQNRLLKEQLDGAIRHIETREQSHAEQLIGVEILQRYQTFEDCVKAAERHARGNWKYVPTTYGTVVGLIVRDIRALAEEQCAAVFNVLNEPEKHHDFNRRSKQNDEFESLTSDRVL